MKLFWKIFVSVFILFFAIISLVLYFVSIEQISLTDAERHLVEKKTIAIDLLSREIEEDYLESKWPLESLYYLSKSKDFLFWWIVRSNGQIHLADRNDLIGTYSNSYFPKLSESLADTRTVVLDSSDLYGITIQPLSLGYDKEKWWLVVGFSLKEVSRIRQGIFYIGLTAFVTALLLLGGMLYFIVKHFVRPVEALTAGADKLGSGELTHRVEVSSKDELGHLSIAFNKMAEDLQNTTVSKRYMDNIIETILDSLVVTDKDGRILTVNRATCDLLGYQREELVGMSAGSILEEDIPRPKTTGEEMDGDRQFRDTETYYRAKDGRRIPILFTASVMRDEEGQTIYMVCTGKDMSEIKRAEEAQQESEGKYRLLVENANDAIFIAQDEVVKFANRMAEKMVGYSAEDLAKIPFINLIHPDDRNMVLERYRRRLKGEGPPSTYSFRLIGKEGAGLWAQLNSVLITWGGRPATLNFLRDITRQKELEAQLQQAQKMEALGTLAGGIAHDFNNLLMAIQGNASLMLLKKDPGHRDYARLKNIEQYIQNGAELTKQLLGFARGGKYEVRAIDLNELLKKSSEMFGRTRKEVTIHPKYQEGVWSVEVDQGQIEQVLMNLYINAWQAMPGGGKLFLETENIELDRNPVRPYGVKPGRYVKISISDTGVGMDKKTRERIFDPFFTTKEMGRGTGLGLASVYGIIKNHGGIIDVSSRKGEGSTFKIYLPASEKEVPREKELPEEILEGTETILLVDDEGMIIDSGREMLQEIGYTLLTAESGMEAIDIYRERTGKIDLVILDMIMPDMGGGETFDRLRELDPEIKVLLSSGYSLDDQAREILRRGCSGFIQKPFNLKEISYKIREILG